MDAPRGPAASAVDDSASLPSLANLPSLAVACIADCLDAPSLVALSGTCRALRPLSASEPRWESLCLARGWGHAALRQGQGSWLGAYRARHAAPGCGLALVARAEDEQRFNQWALPEPPTRSVQLLRVPARGERALRPQVRLRVDGVAFTGASLSPSGRALAFASGGACIVYRVRGIKTAAPYFAAAAATPVPAMPAAHLRWSPCGNFLAIFFPNGPPGRHLLALLRVPPELPEPPGPPAQDLGAPLTQPCYVTGDVTCDIAFSPAAPICAFHDGEQRLNLVRLAEHDDECTLSRFVLARPSQTSPATAGATMLAASVFSHDGRHLWSVTRFGANEGALLEATDVSVPDAHFLRAGEWSSPPPPTYVVDLNFSAPPFKFPSSPVQLAASPDGRYLSLLNCSDECDNGEAYSIVLLLLPPGGPPLQSPGGAALAAPQVFSASELRHVPLPHRARVAQWSPNGRRLLLLLDMTTGSAPVVEAHAHKYAWMLLEPLSEDMCGLVTLQPFTPSAFALGFGPSQPRLWAPGSDAFMYAAADGVFTQHLLTTRRGTLREADEQPAAERLTDGVGVQWGAA